MKNKKQYLQGWECPRCGKIHSPYSMNCDCYQYNRIETKTTFNT